jgi:LytS/YehU family sensor histidine kinase
MEALFLRQVQASYAYYQINKLGMVNSFTQRNLHLLFWTGFGLISLSLFAGTLGIQNAFLKVSFTVASLSFLAYFNILFLIPYFFEKKRYLIYSILIIILIVSISLILIYIDSHFELLKNPKATDKFRITKGFPIYNLLITMTVAIISTTFKLNEKAKQHENLKQLFQNQQLRAELDLLKAQINPHFLFNTLNNIYTLAYLKSDQTAEMISKLSELMRYMLYEGSLHKVLLTKEIAFLKNYIMLYRLKNEDANVSFELVGELSPSTQPMANITIEPLLFIPLIENCFKYCDLSEGQAFIKIDLEVLHDKFILKTENTIDITHHIDTTKPKEIGGIGLKNLQQRLNLLYPQRHLLEVRKENSIFKVNLEIKHS